MTKFASGLSEAGSVEATNGVMCILLSSVQGAVAWEAGRLRPAAERGLMRSRPNADSGCASATGTLESLGMLETPEYTPAEPVKETFEMGLEKRVQGDPL